MTDDRRGGVLIAAKNNLDAKQLVLSSPLPNVKLAGDRVTIVQESMRKHYINIIFLLYFPPPLNARDYTAVLDYLH